MKAHSTGKTLHWFTVPPVTTSPIEDDRQFGFDPDFIVSDEDGDEGIEQDVFFDPDPALARGAQRKI